MVLEQAGGSLCGVSTLDRIRFAFLFSHNRTGDVRTKGKTENKRRRGILTWKTQMWEKPWQPTGCRMHYRKGIQCRGNTEATTSCPLSSPHTAVTTRRQLPVSLSLSIQLILYKITTLQHYNNTTHRKYVP